MSRGDNSSTSTKCDGHLGLPESFKLLLGGPLAFVGAMLLAHAPVDAQDCNGNGVDDSVETTVRLAFAEVLRFHVAEDATTLAAGDANGDGRADLAAACTKSNSVAILLSDASSERLFQEPLELCAGVDPRGVAWADVDEAAGSGLTDLLVGSEGRQGEDPGSLRPRLTVLWGSEKGAFTPSCAPPCLEALPPECSASDFDAAGGDVPDSDGVRTIEAADLDGDGRTDAVLGLRRSPGAVVALFNAGGRFGTPVLLHAGEAAASRYIAVADLDEDARLDVATAGGDVLFGPHGAGLEPREPMHVADAPGEPRGIALVDVTGDGRADALIASSRSVAGGAGSGSVLVLENLGGRTFAAIEQPALGSLCDLLESIAGADFDLDGDNDLVLTRLLDASNAACSSSGLEVLLNDGLGRFSPALFLPTEPARPRWVLAADFDANGFPDLAAAANRGSLERDEVLVHLSQSAPLALDRDRNGLPDACQFLRGDVDGDSRATITDPIALLGFLFLGGRRPPCLEACDADNDGRLLIADAVLLLLHLFQGGPPPRPPAVLPEGGCRWESGWTDENGILDCAAGCDLTARRG